MSRVMLQNTFPEGDRDQVSFISDLSANLGSNTYFDYCRVSLLCYLGMGGVVGHSGAEDNLFARADINQSKHDQK